LGVDFGAAYSKSSGLQPSGARVDYVQTSWGLAPRVGVDVPLGASLSLYPRGEIGFGRSNQDVTSYGFENQHTSSRVWTSLSIPPLVHVSTPFFTGFGPYLSHDLSRSDQYDRSNRATAFGASLLIGGWL